MKIYKNYTQHTVPSYQYNGSVRIHALDVTMVVTLLAVTISSLTLLLYLGRINKKHLRTNYGYYNMYHLS